MTKKRPGRPPGITAEGVAMRERLYCTAIRSMARRGYAETTLRDVAKEADVSPALLYKYFASKQDVVLAFYDELSLRYAADAAEMPAGKWRERFLFALRASMQVLAPHRDVLTSLTSILVSAGENGVFSVRTAFSRERVMGVFVNAVTGAGDSPGKLAAPLGRLLYLLHLGVILWWMLDRSANQRATYGFIDLLERTLPPFALMLRLPWMKSLIQESDQWLRSGLLHERASPESSE